MIVAVSSEEYIKFQMQVATALLVANYAVLGSNPEKVAHIAKKTVDAVLQRNNISFIEEED